MAYKSVDEISEKMVRSVQVGLKALSDDELSTQEKGLKLVKVMCALAEVTGDLERARQKSFIKERSIFAAVLGKIEGRSLEERLAKAKGDPEVLEALDSASQIMSRQEELKVLLSAFEYAQKMLLSSAITAREAEKIILGARLNEDKAAGDE
jgi:hypothetical protein